MSDISPKAAAGALGAAVGSVLVILVTIIWPDSFTQTQATGLAAGVATIVAFLFAYLVPDPARVPCPEVADDGSDEEPDDGKADL